MRNSNLLQLEEEIKPLREKLKTHPIYTALKTIDDLKVFMEHHVYAVWDFMSVLKVLQKRLTCMNIPWVPQGSADIRYLINQIVLDEESDVGVDGNRISHFELYIQAMEQVGSDTRPILSLINHLTANGYLSFNEAQSKSTCFCRILH